MTNDIATDQEIAEWKNDAVDATSTFDYGDLLRIIVRLIARIEKERAENTVLREKIDAVKVLLKSNHTAVYDLRDDLRAILEGVATKEGE